MKRKIALILVVVLLLVLVCALVVGRPTNEVSVQNQTYQFLTGNGFTHVQACGIMASIKVNSNFDPTATPPNGLGYGLLQWTGVRYEWLEKFANKIGEPVEAIETQLMFLVADFKSNGQWYKWNDFMNAETAKEAAVIFHIEYSKPASTNVIMLESFAEEFYEFYSG